MKGITTTFWKMVLVIILGITIFLIMLAFLGKISEIDIERLISWFK